METEPASLPSLFSGEVFASLGPVEVLLLLAMVGCIPALLATRHRPGPRLPWILAGLPVLIGALAATFNLEAVPELLQVRGIDEDTPVWIALASARLYLAFGIIICGLNLFFITLPGFHASQTPKSS